MTLLAEVFAIELCAYALMGNHYHLVVKLNPEASHSWSDTDIVERWTQLFAGPALAQKVLRGDRLSPSESMQVKRLTELWRERLGDLSWFMRCLNEYIARKANAEDQCTGHFWESRFKSQALLDDTALITAMAYVDLNPVRAGIAARIPESDYTSAQARWRSITDVPTAGTENDEDSHFTVSAGYAFDFGLGVNLGWKHTNAARIESETVGFLLTYEISLGPWPR